MLTLHSLQTIRLILMLSLRSSTWGWGSAEARAPPAPPSPARPSPPRRPPSRRRPGPGVLPCTSTVSRLAGTAPTPCRPHKCQIKQVSLGWERSGCEVMILVTRQLQINANSFENMQPSEMIIRQKIRFCFWIHWDQSRKYFLFVSHFCSVHVNNILDWTLRQLSRYLSSCPPH